MMGRKSAFGFSGSIGSSSVALPPRQLVKQPLKFAPMTAISELL
jgi:hypothetical protein